MIPILREINKDYAENILENDLVNRLSNLQYKLFADKNQSITDNSTREWMHQEKMVELEM